jgi:small subunit ribosomal protein S4
MAKRTDPVCKVCRREGTKLMLKGDRCFTPKCAVEKRPYAPGEHGNSRRRRPKETDYGLQLREKQKARRVYGILERQFRRYFREAERMRGVTATNLLRLLEGRLDNVVFRMGFASSRAQARVLVTHGHFHVNGRRVDIPSYSVRVGDTVSIREKSRQISTIQGAMETSLRSGLPPWIVRDDEAFEGKILRQPTVEEIAVPVNEQMIVEMYSR